MDSRLAVDIALIPPPEIVAQIISLTAHLPDASTRLNNVDCLPHITLAMGIISKDKLQEATAALQGLSVNPEEIAITIARTRTYKWDNSSLEPFSELVVNPNPQLVNLHQEVMQSFKSLLTYTNVQLNDFISPPEVARQSIYWVEHYSEHHQSSDNYNAHITLGEGVIEKLEHPITYSGSQLVLCHLGTYCTCRKILIKA